MVIGNGSYDVGPLKNPINDATDMAVALKQLGFDVILKTNARIQDMDDAVREFGIRLKRGGGRSLLLCWATVSKSVGEIISKSSSLNLQPKIIITVLLLSFKLEGLDYNYVIILTIFISVSITKESLACEFTCLG